MALAPALAVPLVVPEAGGEGVGVAEGVCAPLGEGALLREPVGDADALGAPLPLEVGVALPVELPGLPVGGADADAVADAGGDAVAVPLASGVGVASPDAEALGEPVGLPRPLPEALPEASAEAEAAV